MRLTLQESGRRSTVDSPQINLSWLWTMDRGPWTKRVLLWASVALLWVWGVSARAGEPLPPSELLMAVGEVRSYLIEGLTRVAIGNPEIADVEVVSSDEFLIKSKKAGTTNLILWAGQGQRAFAVTVKDAAPERLASEAERVIRQFAPGVTVKREDAKVFVTGEVSTEGERERLRELTASYPDVVNFVQVVPSLPPPPPPQVIPPLVKLAVQVIELNRTDLEKLGVKWSESLAFTEPQATDQTVSDALFRWGTSLTRSSVSATLNALVQKDRARILAEPKLVTTSGKEASSFIGLEVPIVTATSFGTTTAVASASIEFRQTGVLLKMTPHAHAEEGKVTLVIQAEVSEIDSSVALDVPVGNQTVKVPGFAVRKANTEVTAASGETIMIAGLLQANDASNISQVPALGSMPVVGRLFRSPETKSTQRELIITVTPELAIDAEMATDKTLALEQALAVAGVTASVEDPTLRYALAVQNRIAKAIRYPTREKELGLAGAVRLRLHLFRDGTLGRALIAESSGLELLDNAALKAAESQSPYPPFPSDLPQQELWLEFPVLFR